jgi:pimeloyl-ACP methyl ester carboxylesterase
VLKRLAKILLGLVIACAVAVLSVYFLRPDWYLDGEYARWALLAGAQRREVAVGDHRVAFYEAGNGTPVVLVHGFSGSKENWLPLARMMPLTYRVVMPDLPGWGESTRLADQDYAIEPQVERLGALLDALRIGRAHLVGHSMSGQIAGLYAARHPDRVLTLTLVDAAGVRFKENAFARRVLAGETPFNYASREQFGSFMHELFVKPPWLPPRVVDVLIERNARSYEFQATLLQRLKQEPEALQLEQALPLLRVPTLALWCRGDQLLDVSSLEAIRAGVVRAPLEVEVLEGCSHMPMMEKPGEMAADLLAFFARNPGRR